MAPSSANSSAGTAAMSTSPRTATAGAFCSWASTTRSVAARGSSSNAVARAAVDSLGSRSTASSAATNGSAWSSPLSLDRFVGRSRGCDERQLESVALRALVERDQQVQTRGVDEGQAAQIEHQAPGILDSIQRGAQRLNGGKVEFAVGLHDRDIVAPLHVDARTAAGEPLDAADPVRRAVDDEIVSRRSAPMTAGSAL